MVEGADLQRKSDLNRFPLENASLAATFVPG